MGNFLNPKLNILPSPQLKLWHELSTTPSDFILYGGTAIALRLGHRVSVDFDFFSPNPFDPEDLYRKVPYLKESRIMQQTTNTLTCCIDRGGEVLVSFFGGLNLGQVEKPSIVLENQIHIASLLDLAGTKAAVIQKRVEMKDYLDIYALLTLGKLKLDIILACGGTIYGKIFNPIITLKAMCYFDDSELNNLSEEIKTLFAKEVRSIDLNKLPILHSAKLGD